MNPSERRLIAYAATAHALTHVIEITYPALLTRIEDDFGLRAIVTGAFATAFGWALGSSAIPAGYLTDRLGSRRVVVYAFTGAAVMALIVGLAPNEWWLLAGLIGLGLSVGLYHPAGLSLMAQGVRQRGMAIGLHGVAGNSGQAIAPALAVGMAITFDWRAGFFLVAALAALMAMVMARIRLPLSSGLETAEAPASAVDSAASVDGKRNLMRSLLVVYAAFILGGVVYRGAITYLPKHLEDFVNRDFGGAFVTVALMMGAAGQFVGGTLSQRFVLERLAPVIALAVIPALVLMAVLSGAPLVALASLFVFSYFANQPVLTGLIADYSPAGAVGRSYGISFFAGFGVGSLGGVIAGALVDRWDTRAAFVGLSGFMAVTLTLLVLLWIMAERRQRPAANAAVRLSP